jgi:hypothetical protein
MWGTVRDRPGYGSSGRARTRFGRISRRGMVGRPGGAPVQTWEYKTWFPVRGGRYITDEHLNRMGAEGWELVGIAPYPVAIPDDLLPTGVASRPVATTKIMYIFKRPLANDTQPTLAD